MSDTPPPIVLALVPCEGLYVESRTGRRTLVGLLSALSAPAYPVALPMLVVHVAVTALRTATLFVVRVADATDGGEVLADDPVLTPDPPDPVAVCEFEVQFQNVLIPAAGVYVVQLESDGVVLAERRIEFVLPEGDGND